MSITTHINDFAWMKQGRQIHSCSQADAMLLKTYKQRHSNTTGKALLMLHGFSSSPAVFRLMYTQLQEYDFIYAPLLPGHGVTLQQFARTARNQWVHSAKQCFKEIYPSYQQIDVLGLSLGGLLACHLAQELPVNRLVLLAPALALKTPLSRLLAIAKLAQTCGFQFIRNCGGRTCAPQADELLYKLLPISAVLEILQLIAEFRLSGWNCPTEVFLGRHDTVVDSVKVAQMLQSLNNVNIHFLEQSNHVLPLDGNYLEIINLLGKASPHSSS